MKKLKSEIRSTSNNIQIIDLVRSLSILSVIASHFGPAFDKTGAVHSWLWERISSNGTGGVFMFFVVSGFLITRIIDLGPGKLFKSNWKNFYARRVGRIVPLFLLYVFLGLAVMLTIIIFGEISPLFGYCFKLPLDAFDPSFWFPLFTFTLNWVGAYYFDAWQGIGAHWALLWSLCLEEQFYLFYPLVLKFLGNKKIMFRIFIPLIGFGFFWKLIVPSFGFGTAGTAIRMYISGYALIAEGILLYLVSKQFGSFFAGHKRFCGVIVILGACILAYSYSGFIAKYWVYRDLVIGPGLFLLLLGGIHLDFFENKYFRLMALPGKYSYGGYLLHVIVLYFVFEFLRGLNVLIAFVLYASLTTLVAAFSYHFFEIPSNRFVRRLFDAK